MKHISTRLLGAGLASALLLPSLTAQIETVSIAPDIVRGIPPSLGSGEAKRLVAFDADSDLVEDFAVLWSGGQLVFSYALANIDSMWACPVNLARDVTRIAAPFAPSEALGKDGLLVAEEFGLCYLHLDNASSSPTGTIVRQMVESPSESWDASIKLEAYVRGTNQSCLVLGLDPDSHTIRIGEWIAGKIGPVGPVGQVTASSPVQQMMFVDFLHDGVLHVVARTNAGLQIWDLDGNLVLTAPATTPHWNGAMCTVRNGLESEVAWASVTSSNWNLRRVFKSASGLVATAGNPIAVPAGQPQRFRVVGLSPMTLAGSNQEDLLLEQNSFAASLRLRRNDMGTADAADDTFYTQASIPMPGLTPNQDNCASVVGDLVRGSSLDSEEIASVRTNSMSISIAAAAVPTQPADALQLIGPNSSMILNSLGKLDLDLDIVMPTNYGSHSNLPTTPNLAVQVTAWPQFVNAPTAGSATNIAGYVPSQCSPATANTYYFPWPIGSLSQRFLVPLGFAPTVWGGGRNQAYISVRVVQFTTPPSGTAPSPIAWATESQLVGLAHYTEPGFMLNIRASTTSNPPSLSVSGPSGDSRDAGVMVHRGPVRPPTPSLPIPVPPAPTVRQQ